MPFDLGWSWTIIYRSSIGWLENIRMSTQITLFLYHNKKLSDINKIYLTHPIITCSLHTSDPLFSGQKHLLRGFFLKIMALFTICSQKRLVIKCSFDGAHISIPERLPNREMHELHSS